MSNRQASLLLLTLLAPSAVFGDWNETFNKRTVPAGWEFLTPPWSTSDTFSVDASAGYLAISESRSINQGGTEVIRAINTNESFADVRVSADVNLDPTKGTFMGVTVDNLDDAYLFGIDFTVDGDAWLAQAGPAVNGIVQWGSKTDFGISTLLDINSSYHLELDIVGQQMTGRVYDAAGGTELISITHAIPSPLPGPLYAGVYSSTTVGFDDLPTFGAFDNITAASLPLAAPERRMIFSDPENVLSVSSNRFENFPHVSPDGLRIYFASDAPEANALAPFGELPEIYVAERTSVEEPFGERVRLGGNQGNVNFLGSVSDDELSIYYSSFHPAQQDAQSAYVVTRNSIGEAFDFSTATQISELNDVGIDVQVGHVASDGLTIYFNAAGNNFRPYVATRATVDVPFSNAEPIGSPGVFVEDVSADGLTLFGDFNKQDLFMATRSSVEAAFGPFEKLSPVVNSSSNETFPFFHESTSTLYFTSNRPGTIVPQIPESPAPVRDIWQSKISFAGDFDFDGTFTVADINRLSAAIRGGEYHFNLDTNGDSHVDTSDRDLWVQGSEFANTYFGDANLDGEFNSGDMVDVFSAGKYETDADAGWAEGDWNGDGRFESGDLVAAFRDGGYEQGSRAAIRAVPEPISIVPIAIGGLSLLRTSSLRRDTRKQREPRRALHGAPRR